MTIQAQLSPFSTYGNFNNIAFVIQRILSKVQTATLVEVISCTNAGGLSPVGTLKVKPCVNQVDGDGNAYPHTTIFNVPYVRMFGGNNAVILDPEAGDIGVAVFASRDVSSVKNTQAAANPASARQYDFSDALYIGGTLNGGTPSQYVQFSSSGIKIVSPTKITIQAPEIDLEGVVVQSGGTISSDTDVIAGATNISLANHIHTSGGPGSPTSPPTP